MAVAILHELIQTAAPWRDCSRPRVIAYIRIVTARVIRTSVNAMRRLVPQDGIEPSTVSYQETVLAIRLQRHESGTHGRSRTDMLVALRFECSVSANSTTRA